MTVLRPLLIALAVAALPPGVAGQADVSQRLDGRVPPDVVRAVADIAAAAGARGLPVDPLVDKALEGGAKGVPAPMVIAAVRALATRLEAAAGALHDAGLEAPPADLVEGAAYALNARLSAHQVRDLVRASHPPYDAVLTLRVAATLAALGVPPRQAVDLVEQMMNSGREPGDLLALPGQVQAGVAGGATPSQAASGLARAASHAPATPRPPRQVPPGQTNPHRP